MSVYIYTKMTVTGNAEILRDFVYYFENTYDDQAVYSALHHAVEVAHEYLDDNCYCVEGEANHFVIQEHILSKKFPGLKFENITECSDGDDVSDYSICINGKQVDYADGNSSAFGPYVTEEVKCSLCNASAKWLCNDEYCDECNDFRIAMKNRLVNSGHMTWDEYFVF